jgi:hypothetical protein
MIIATVFWDSKGVLHLDSLAGQKAINVQYYSALLNEKAKSAIHSDQRKRQDSVCFLQDNAGPHTAAFNYGNSTETAVGCTASPSVQSRLSLFGPMTGFYEARGSRIMVRSLQVYSVGYRSHRKPSWKLELRSFQQVGRSAFQSTGTTLKSSA